MRFQHICSIVAALALLIAVPSHAALDAAMSALTFTPINFCPARLIPTMTDLFDLVPAGDLERTPRLYQNVTVTLTGRGTSDAVLILVDVLGRELRSPRTLLKAGQTIEISLDVPPGKAASESNALHSMIRAIRMRVRGQRVDVTDLRITCMGESLPTPHATVGEPHDDTSIQAAIDALGPDGGVVYIPAGEYIIHKQVTIPCSNITIYGDGASTIIQGTWPDSIALIKAEKQSNIRITRLHLRSLPITDFRGYNEKQHARVHEDANRPSVISRGIEFSSCTNCRVDRCEVELFGHAGIIFYGGKDNCVDHCYLHENFRYGYGYGIATPGTTELYIEDNNFENHRHGIAGNADEASYIARFNRLVKDAAVFESWNQSPDGINQLRAHEIDAHPKCSWIYAHDNYVAMFGAMMSGGAMMRGNHGWLYRNVFENCPNAIYCIGNSSDVWTWENQSITDQPLHYSTATGDIHFSAKPDNFTEFPYPYKLNQPDWWPGASDTDFAALNPQNQFAGPNEAVLRIVD